MLYGIKRMRDKHTEPEFSKSALITIDTQCDTLDGQPLEIPGTSQALANMKLLLDEYRKLRLPILHIVRIYEKDGSNVDLCRRAAVDSGSLMLLEGTPGCQLAKDLFDEEVKLQNDLLLSGGIQSLSENEVIIYKSRWGAFYKTPLEKHLRDKGISTLIFTGCNFPNCPRTSIYETSERDLKIVLVSDATSGLYEQGEKEMRNIGVSVLTTTELTQKLEGSAAEPIVAPDRGTASLNRCG